MSEQYIIAIWIMFGFVDAVHNFILMGRRDDDVWIYACIAIPIWSAFGPIPMIVRRFNG